MLLKCPYEVLCFIIDAISLCLTKIKCVAEKQNEKAFWGVFVF